MKRITLIISIIAITATLKAQTNEYNALFSPISIRGNIGLHTGAINLGNENSIVKTGASASVILNQKLSIGVIGNGFVGSQAVKLENEDYSLFGGYGGVQVEPIILPNSVLHITLPISFGGGRADYFQDSLGYEQWDVNYDQGFYNIFTYIEPGINVELNLTKFMRFGISGSYLLTNTLNNSELSKTNLDGLSIAATLKLGWFK